MNTFSQLSLPQRARALTGMLIALFIAALGQTIIVTAMPTIVTDLHGFNLYTWPATAYMVMAVVSTPIAGRLSDIYGRRVFLIVSTIIFVISSIFAGLSQSMPQLILARVVQGIGGGIITSSASVSIADLFPPAERGKYVGMVVAAYGAAGIIAPVLGGFITDHFSWRWIFFINLPIGILAVLTLHTYPDKKPSLEKHRIDYAGMLTLVLAVVPTLLALSLGGVQYAWTSTLVLACLSFGLVMTVLFVLIELKASAPILPLNMYRSRIIIASTLVAFLSGFVIYSSILFVPLFSQGATGASATSSGSLLTAMMLAMVGGATISGQLLSRCGHHYRLHVLVGTVLATVGACLVCTLDSDIHVMRTMIYIVIMGIGLGAALSTNSLAVQNSVDFNIVGVASSMMFFHRLSGGMFGLAVLGAVMTHNFMHNAQQTISANIRATLPAAQLDAIINNPKALVDATALDKLKHMLLQLNPNGEQMASELLTTLNTALSDALSSAFTINAAAAIIAVFAALLMGQIDKQ